MIRAITSWLAPCLLAAGVFAEAGQAATVEMRPGDFDEFIRYVGGPGERNDVVFEEVEDSRPAAFVVRDTGAPLAVGDGCVSIDPHTAACVTTSGSVSHVRARLGDGDDGLRLVTRSDAFLVAYGGPGDDRLLGGTKGDRLDGGGGTDELHGGAGNDALKDGDRDGAEGPARPGPDVLDGGPGRDHLTYDHRTRGVRVDLADARPDGAAGELDRLSAIESVTGGAGDDRLAGNARANVLVGGGGRNRLTGRGGNDDLYDATAGTVTCGAGRDDVARVGPRTLVSRSCEFVRLPITSEDFLYLASHPSRRGRRLGFLIDCPYYEEYATCSARIEIRARRRLLAHGRLTLNGGDWGFLGLTRTPLGVKLNDARRHPIATVSIRGFSVPTARWTIRF